ncbi:type I-E CRISPR-associated protein Cas7/Cse4/CasC [Gilliamella apicola]|uniref:type I-E CRISPR-associated protein Cas7/Cse4/CasC n=1 Tax=Gilliamella apicola TaxID=1196095 RepID=UPI000A355BEC|nr:type I-E CRISPR-associated protein Cas7/Cse4/CasC [Gilliamella apicola]OTQ30670.1 type I-E CRISPR-associated protein Cas7/Cse4/CasC [Gilliamella apicola]OTQ44342.1 type I-E CRISPR-associated protein Cas7/Cse4/CasC [Gilliamella apicola]
MTTFIQLHLLTAYAPSNLNRDDLGRPKTAKMGNTDRLRISSQSLKRAWRTSDCFYQSLSDHIGVRSRRFARDWVYKPMIDNGISEKIAKESAIKIAGQFGKLKNEKSPKDPLTNLEIEQLVHISNYEQQAIKQLVDLLISEKREPTDNEVKLLRKENSSIDIALFGRMLADSLAFNIEAACQVSHALGVSTVTIEDDFFTAVDDLNKNGDPDAGSGSGHLGERGFASALFYTYVCISRDLLLENLNGDEVLVEKTLKALTESAAKVAPTGMQNSFASRAYTSYLLIEKGSQQPRSLAVAYFNPIRSQDLVNDAITRLEEQRDKFDKVYGQCADSRYVLNSETGEGTLSAALDFVAQK